MKKIKINIAGAVVHFESLIKELRILQLTNKNIQFTVYEGPNKCQWNGGRINRDIELTDEIIQKYNNAGISISLAFTNPEIDLTDQVGNELLQKLNYYGNLYNVKNKIVLVNEDLRKYLRENYDFELIYSITGHQSDVKITDNLINYYKELELKYDYIVPKFELVFQEDFYNNINVEQYELLINDTCKYACPFYYEHFKEIAKQNTLSKNPWKELGFDHCYKTEECWLPKFDPSIGSEQDKEKHKDKLGMAYNREMMQNALKIGYNCFKLSGRENTSEHIVNDIKRYINDINEK